MCKQQAKVKKLKELFNITYIQFTIVSIHVQYTYYLISTGRIVLKKKKKKKKTCYVYKIHTWVHR